MSNYRFPTALIKHACPVCGNAEDAEILLSRKPTKSEDTKVDQMNGKVIGFMKKPCNTCKELMKQGVLLIEIDESKSKKLPNGNIKREEIWRTGHQFVVSKEAFERIFEGPSIQSFVEKNGFMLIDKDAADKVGLHEPENQPDANT